MVPEVKNVEYFSLLNEAQKILKKFFYRNNHVKSIHVSKSQPFKTEKPLKEVLIRLVWKSDLFLNVLF